jgi:HD-GYP domain-containing protein (c-di-GMP phosphodiesterase class II)/DNA-binding CsgD family transcriptional regulator
MAERLRLAELMAALSLATDLGMGQPLEQALRTCLIALALGDRLGLTKEELSEVFYVALLRFLGCTADAHEFANLVGGDDIAVRRAIAPALGGSQGEFAAKVIPRIGAGHGPVLRGRLVVGMMTSGPARAREGVRAHCEMGEILAKRLNLAPGVNHGLADAFERWSGQGFPKGTSGSDIHRAARVVFVARDVEILRRDGGIEQVRAAIKARSGRAYDPEIAAAFVDHSAHVLDALDITSPWDAVLAREPEPYPWVPESRLDSVLETYADFIDLKSPFTPGHSRGVAELAGRASTQDAVTVRRAALVHDLGRISVPNGIWDKPSVLTDGEWERVRLHPYYSERILSRPLALKSLAPVAGMHHERNDGSGYHRGSKSAEIPPAARLLAAADAYQAMTQRRAHRPALAPDRAAAELESDARAGRLDPVAVNSVLSAAGHHLQPMTRAWPAGLSDREVEVLRLICRGGTKKEVAGLLKISPSTVDHHVRHIYDKAGVSTRAGATLFAVDNRLLV